MAYLRKQSTDGSARRARGTVSLLEYSRLKNENRQMKEIIGVLTVELAKLKKKS